MLNTVSHVFRHLSDRNTASLGVHSRRYVHGCQLLKEKLGSIWKNNLSDLRLVLARSALELILFEGSVKSSVCVSLSAS